MAVMVWDDLLPPKMHAVCTVLLSSPQRPFGSFMLPYTGSNHSQVSVLRTLCWTHLLAACRSPGVRRCKHNHPPGHG